MQEQRPWRVSRGPIRPNERTGGLSCSHDSIDHERSSAGACFRPFARLGPGCRRLDSSSGVGTRTAQHSTAQQHSEAAMGRSCEAGRVFQRRHNSRSLVMSSGARSKQGRWSDCSPFPRQPGPGALARVLAHDAAAARLSPSFEEVTKGVDELARNLSEGRRKSPPAATEGAACGQPESWQRPWLVCHTSARSLMGSWQRMGYRRSGLALVVANAPCITQHIATTLLSTSDRLNWVSLAGPCRCG